MQEGATCPHAFTFDIVGERATHLRFRRDTDRCGDLPRRILDEVVSSWQTRHRNSALDTDFCERIFGAYPRGFRAVLAQDDWGSIVHAFHAAFNLRGIHHEQISDIYWGRSSIFEYEGVAHVVAAVEEFSDVGNLQIL